MGTDIHGVFQRFDATTQQWEDVPSEYTEERHYQLFAVLADVRNGYGFAGIKTGEAVEPIAAPRGLPKDFKMDDDFHPIASLEHMSPLRREWHQNGEKFEVWMGDHSFSWLTGDEMLAWAENSPKVLKTGVLARKDYEKWDEKSVPERYSGGVCGSNVIQINDNALEKKNNPTWNYIRCHWESDLAEELEYFFDEIRELVQKHGTIRFVFGFDS
jgi:hypothetical protein